MGCGASVDNSAKERNEAIETQLKKDRMMMRSVVDPRLFSLNPHSIIHARALTHSALCPAPLSTSAMRCES